jgi:hypothetical protein
VSILDQLGQLWHGLIGFIEKIVIPDWSSVIGLLPVLLVLGVLGPILSILALVWAYQLARRPRTRLRFAAGPTPAPLGEDDRPAFPRGLPFCPRDGLIYAPGTRTCDRCAGALSVTCPMCGLGRAAAFSTCGECGLVLKVEPRAAARQLRPVGPPPGGAAAA